MSNIYTRSYLGSTEPQARKVLSEIQEKESRPTQAPKETGNTTTAKSPPGVEKTKEQGDAELKALREKRNK